MPAGRPSSYRPEFAKQAYNLCLLGATNDDLAKALGVAGSTIDLWIAENEEFSGSVKSGREEADAKVASRLFSRACGYKHQAVKIVADAKTGAEHIVPYTERYPPDTVAAIFWLKNRRPELWRDRQEITGKDGKDLIPEDSGKLALALLSVLTAKSEEPK